MTDPGAPHDLSADLELAVAAARDAGDVVMQWFRQPLDVRYKEPGQPLTEADLAADRTLRQRLIGDRPDYGWLSEESVDTADRLARPRVWIVDPIDGTRSFIAGRPEFTISIGLAVDGMVAVGVVYNPATGELFSALRDGGARLHQGDDSLVLELPATAAREAGGSTVRLLASRTEIDAGEFSGFGAGWQVAPVGSTAYKLARIAAGLGDGFLSRGPKSEWDICAGVLLVREAGGRVTDLRGAEPLFNGPDPYVHGILAARADMHEAVMRHMARLPATDRLRR
ncbi:MAG TPA: 3'(2'),5'-bisphosphate nucleotidase CysQ [Longimicrobiales bacterium]|nr:3'(2'),5'-bisphosphate nucleotidase CysQ [Longimicrobiales bacterium]